METKSLEKNNLSTEYKEVFMKKLGLQVEIRVLCYGCQISSNKFKNWHSLSIRPKIRGQFFKIARHDTMPREKRSSNILEGNKEKGTFTFSPAANFVPWKWIIQNEVVKIIVKKKKEKKRNKLRELKHGHKQQIEIPQPIIEEEKKNHSLLRFYFAEFFCTFQMYCMLVSFHAYLRILFICAFYINEYN